MKYLTDSDWVISHLRGVEVLSRNLRELGPEGIALSIISVAEIYDGIYGRQSQTQEETFRDFLSNNIRVLALDEEICRIFARERVRLRRAGTPVGNMDLFIASTALRHSLIVLTNNRRHFGLVEGLEIISI